MAAGPADLAGLTGKGRIEPGADADLVAFAPDGPSSSTRARCGTGTPSRRTPDAS